MRDIRTLGATAAAVVVTAVLSAGGAVWASHQFPDVPDSGFHDQIGAIVDAGCASGFNDGTFGPRDSTTRGQFAYWTDNCGSRLVESFTDVNQQIASSPTGLLEVEVDVNGATPGATQLVRIDAVMTFACEPSLNLSSTGTGDITLTGGPGVSPGECLIEYGIVEDGQTGGPDLVHSHLLRTFDGAGQASVQPTGVGPSTVTATVTASKVFEVAPGTHTFRLTGVAAPSDASSVAEARTLTAHVAPFGSTQEVAN